MAISFSINLEHCNYLIKFQKNENELLGEVDVAIPVFHCFAHITKCQVTFMIVNNTYSHHNFWLCVNDIDHQEFDIFQILYNPKRKADFRLADGENIERFWSDMDNFSRTSRTMTKTHRQDVLAFVFLNYGNRVINEARMYILILIH